MGLDAHELTTVGRKMSSADRASLEEQVANNPTDIDSRTKLLGYYFFKGHDASTVSSRQRHIVWLIENAPEAEVLGLPYGTLLEIIDKEGYERAKKAWLTNIQKTPDNVAVLRNASEFFLLNDRKISEELLLKGQTLDSKDPNWPASLGHLYELDLTSLPAGPARTATANKSFRHYKQAYDLSDAENRESLLDSVGKAALAAGRNDDAKAYAIEMLNGGTMGWNQGNRIHHGNLILGRVALSDGNVEEAKSRLLLAGETSGSPQLNSFGPNMHLAQELLERGETEVVLEYLELCKKFWSMSNGSLDKWAEDVKSNRIPEFGANLSY